MDTRPTHRTESDSSPAGRRQPAVMWGNPCVWDVSGSRENRQVEYPEFYSVLGVWVEINTNQLVNRVARDYRDAMLGWETASRRLMTGILTGKPPVATAGLPPVGTFPLTVGVSTLSVDGEPS